jgi:hypothetical protein
MDENYSFRLEFVGPDGRPVAQLETWPGHGNYPTSLWRVAEPFCDLYEVPVRGYQSLPEQLSLRVTVLDGVGGDKLPVGSLAGHAVGFDALIPWSP